MLIIRRLYTLKYIIFVLNEREEKIKAHIKEKYAHGFNKQNVQIQARTHLTFEISAEMNTEDSAPCCVTPCSQHFGTPCGLYLLAWHYLCQYSGMLGGHVSISFLRSHLHIFMRTCLGRTPNSLSSILFIHFLYILIFYEVSFKSLVMRLIV